MGHSHDVYLEYNRPVVRLEIGKRETIFSRSNGSGVDKMSDRSDRVDRFFECRVHRCFIGDIHGNTDHVCRMLTAQLVGESGELIAAIPECNSRPLAGKASCGGQSDSTRSTDNNNRVTSEF